MHKSDTAFNSTALHHAHFLAEKIGPRGSTTLQEAQAADYAHQVLEDAGLQPSKEIFSSPQSIWRPYALASAIALAAQILFLFGAQPGAILASLLMLVVIGSTLAELTFRDNLLRWVVPKGSSQNVWVRIPSSGPTQRRVVISGHLDSHRTPKVFSSARWQRIFLWLVPVGLASLALNAIIFIIGIFSPWNGWRSLSMLLAIVAWWLSVLTFEADYTPYTAGANDNASGASIVLSLAAHLAQQPLQHTEIWAVCTGCEEVGCYGAVDFIARHRSELLSNAQEGPGKAYWITLDSVGCNGSQLCYLKRHTFLSIARSDSRLLRLADAVAARRPELEAKSLSVTGGFTESHIAVLAGLPVLTFANLDPDGYLPHWHQVTDVFAHLDQTILQNTETFVCDLLTMLDEEASPEPASAQAADGPSAEG